METSFILHAETQVNDHTDTNTHEDGCSPFCVCACCGVLLQNKIVQAALEIPVPVFNKNYPAQVYNKPVETNSAIWQPPRI
jgi:hypothetical protein